MKSSLVSLLLVLGCVTTASPISFYITEKKTFRKVETVEGLGDIDLLTVKHGTSTRHHICLKPSQDIIDAADNKVFSFTLYYADMKPNVLTGIVVRGTPWDEKMACGEVYRGSQILYDFEHNKFHNFKLQLSRITWKKGKEPKNAAADKDKAKTDADKTPLWEQGWTHKQEVEDGMNVYQL
ncbi:hypothetical protein ACQY0O_004170 [Thecaphora frezii]